VIRHGDGVIRHGDIVIRHGTGVIRPGRLGCRPEIRSLERCGRHGRGTTSDAMGGHWTVDNGQVMAECCSSDIRQWWERSECDMPMPWFLYFTFVTFG